MTLHYHLQVPITHNILDKLHNLYLCQCISPLTRYRRNTVPHTLDLVFSNEENMVDDIRYLPGLGNSDHICKFFNIFII